MGLTWGMIDYQIKEWTEDGDMSNLLTLQSDVENAIKKVIDKNRNEFETKDKTKLLEKLGLNDITKHNKDVKFKYDFHYKFNFGWNEEYILIFNSIIKHWLNGDIIISSNPSQSDVNVMYFHNIEKFYITENDVLIRDEHDNDISFNNNDFFVIHDNTLSPIHILYGDEEYKMTDVFYDIEWVLNRKINGCDRDITFGDFTSCKISTVKVR